MMTKPFLKRIAPQAVRVWYRRTRAAHLAHRLAGVSTPPEWWALIDSYPEFRPLQKERELARLLELVGSTQPARIGEIGTARAGTLFALARAARPDAVLITVDAYLPPDLKAAIAAFRYANQTIISLEGDSHDGWVKEQFSSALHGSKLDVLLIDGDHSYDGVTRDWAMYAPFVREGGLVVLHDIVPDFQQRYGRATTAHTGGVPRFWAELRTRCAHTEEIIDDRGQDGCGLGIVRWSRESLRIPALIAERTDRTNLIVSC
jgi:predicted O-methyltransferase YrrM